MMGQASLLGDSKAACFSLLLRFGGRGVSLFLPVPCCSASILRGRGKVCRSGVLPKAEPRCWTVTATASSEFPVLGEACKTDSWGFPVVEKSNDAIFDLYIKRYLASQDWFGSVESIGLQT